LLSPFYHTSSMRLTFLDLRSGSLSYLLVPYDAKTKID
jgi:hypothetical protein